MAVRDLWVTTTPDEMEHVRAVNRLVVARSLRTAVNVRPAGLHSMAKLTDRELVIIQERRLVEEGVTLETLGRKLGVSKERVRQIEHQALRKLRSSLIRIVGDPEMSGLIPST